MKSEQEIENKEERNYFERAKTTFFLMDFRKRKENVAHLFEILKVD